MDPVKRSLVSLHLSVVLLGATALFSKLIPLSATEITFGRSVIACITLMFMVKLAGEGLALKRGKDYLIAIALGVLMASHWVTYFAAMQFSTVSVGMIALFTFPVITVLLEPLFEKTRIVWQDMVSTIVVLIGVGFILPDLSFDNEVTLGIATGMLSAVLYALRNLFHRKYFSQYTGAQAMTYQTLVISFLLVFFISDDIRNADNTTLLYIAVLGSMFTALPHAMIAASFRHLRAKTFSLVACIQPLYGVIFAVLILNEQPNWQTLIGGILVISAAIYETVNAQKLHQK